MDSDKKKEYIDGLENVKLVIGNGFDLYCGLKTRYSDYFDYKEPIYSNIKKWYKQFFFQYNSDSQEPQRIAVHRKMDEIEKINAWDFYFWLINLNNSESYKDWCWFDVESIISNSLINKKDVYDGNLYWSDVYKFIVGEKSLSPMTSQMKLLISFVVQKNDEDIFRSEDEFYDFLLSQLKEFEKDFGNYVYMLHYKNTPEENKLVFEDYQRAFLKICNLHNVKEIDSFNYDCFEDKYTDSMLRNINGTYDNPIFGIDSKNNMNFGCELIFTKTSRRMELDMQDAFDCIEKPFDHVIVFGHSLDEADYSYFFPLLDKLNMLDITKKNVIVFEYNVYDLEDEERIKKTLREKINMLFIEYAKDRKYSGNPGRLLDSLTMYGRVLIYEVPSLK